LPQEPADDSASEDLIAGPCDRPARAGRPAAGTRTRDRAARLALLPSARARRAGPARLKSALIKAFAAAPPSSTAVRRYRGEPSPLVRSGDGSWRSGRLDAVLRGDFDLLGADEPPP
jgi:hypothetical protein